MKLFVSSTLILFSIFSLFEARFIRDRLLSLLKHREINSSESPRKEEQLQDHHRRRISNPQDEIVIQEEGQIMALKDTVTLPLTCDHIRQMAREPPSSGYYTLYTPEKFENEDEGFHMKGELVYCDMGDARSSGQHIHTAFMTEDADDKVTHDNPTDKPAGPLSYARDCADIYSHYLSGDPRGQSGTYIVYNPLWYEVGPRGMRLLPLHVYCDMRTAGGGWTLFQRRQDGSVDFYRNYHDYVHGFGQIGGEHWLGLRFMNMLTSLRPNVLLIQMVGRADGKSSFAKYNGFKIGDDNENYKLTVGCYSGNDTQGDRMTYHNGASFSAYDRDQDIWASNCAKDWRGGWWYKVCYHANLNGEYSVTSGNTAINWYNGGGPKYTKSFVTMSFRPEFYN